MVVRFERFDVVEESIDGCFQHVQILHDFTHLQFRGGVTFIFIDFLTWRSIKPGGEVSMRASTSSIPENTILFFVTFKLFFSFYSSKLTLQNQVELFVGDTDAACQAADQVVQISLKIQICIFIFKNNTTIIF